MNSVTNDAGVNLKINVIGVDNSNNYITIRGKKYHLVDFHFHYKSEHTIDGRHSTMEIHFVNVAADHSYTVLAVLVDLGAENSTLQNLFVQSPTGYTNLVSSKS